MSTATISENPTLSLLAISKRFGATKALDQVDLVLRRGEVVALLGANGAGKSTLAKIASGVSEPDQGQIFLNGRPARFLSPRSARENGVITVHQATDQLGVAGVSIAQNLILDELCGRTFPVFVGNVMHVNYPTMPQIETGSFNRTHIYSDYRSYANSYASSNRLEYTVS